MPDDVGLGVGADHAAGERGAEELAELHDVVAAGEGHDVHRVLRVRGGDDERALREFAGGKGDAGVREIIARGGDHGGALEAAGRKAGGILEVGDDDIQADVVPQERLLDVLHDEGVGELVFIEPVDEGCGDCVVVRDEDVVLESRGNGARSAGVLLRLHERRVEELDEGERHQNEKKTMPLRRTTTEKKRPMSLLKVMSPKPSVDMVTMTQ